MSVPDIVHAAEAEAIRLGSRCVSTEHALLALARGGPEGVFPALCNWAGADLAEVAGGLEAVLRGPLATDNLGGRHLPWTNGLRAAYLTAINACEAEKSLGADEVFLLILARDRQTPSRKIIEKIWRKRSEAEND